MKARAKCKKCSDIIETEGKEVYCKCGEISAGKNGDPLRCSALDFKNFIRVDDEGNEIQIQVKEKEKPTKEELLDALNMMINDIEKLPANAKVVSVNQYDMLSVLYLMLSFFSLDSED